MTRRAIQQLHFPFTCGTERIMWRWRSVHMGGVCIYSKIPRHTEQIQCGCLNIRIRVLANSTELWQWSRPGRSPPPTLTAMFWSIHITVSFAYLTFVRVFEKWDFNRRTHVKLMRLWSKYLETRLREWKVDSKTRTFDFPTLIGIS